MTKVEVKGDRLTVTMCGLDKLWTLKSALAIPLVNVRNATADPGVEPKGMRSPGTYVPRVITAGTYRHDGDKVFWNVRNRAKAVVIELENEAFQRLVIEVSDPRKTVQLVEQALTAQRSR